MKQRGPLIAGFSAVLLALITVAGVEGYAGQVAGSITVAVKDPSACGQPTTLTATVLDASGKPVVGQSVDWALVTTLASPDKVNTTPTTTNSSGVATTTVTLACVDGSRSVRATAGQVSAQMVLGVAVGGLPNTSTVPGTMPVTPGAPLVVTFLALAFAVGGGLTLRRLATTRR